MLDTLERRYLIDLADKYRRAGMNAEEAEARILQDVGPFCAANRIRCALRFVFDPCDVHSAAIF